MIRFTEVRSHLIKPSVQLPGTVESRLVSTVAGEISGLVESFLAREGQVVKQGQVLAQLRRTSLELRLRAALAQAGRALQLNLVLALVITYLLLSALFESFLYPFVIMFSVPLAALGGFLGLKAINLFLTYQPLDVLTMLGFIILIGTVVNNAILIVHQSLNHIRQEGLPSGEAIGKAVEKRIRPIFMSVSTSVFAMLPLVLFPGAGSELYRGLGGVVIGGLVVSTIFTIFLVPALFSLTLDARTLLLGQVKRLAGSEEGTPSDA